MGRIDSLKQNLKSFGGFPQCLPQRLWTSLWLIHLHSAGSNSQGCPTSVRPGREMHGIGPLQSDGAPVLAGLAGDREAGRGTMVSSLFSDLGRPVVQE